MPSQNQLFKRFSRLNELQITNMALSELESSLHRDRRTHSAAMHRIALAMQQKCYHIKTAPNALTEIIRRALSSSPQERYDCITDMIIELHRARAQIETEMQARIQRQMEENRHKTPWYERAMKPTATVFTTLLIICLLTGGGLALHYLFPNGVFLKDVEIPQMVGQNLNDMKTDEKLFSLDITYQFHNDSPSGTILSQSPTAGMVRHVSPGIHPCKITLYVSLGPEQVQVGDYAGMTKYQALTECRRLGLIPSIQKISNHPAGNVAKSEPPAGTVLQEGSEIILYVGTSHHVSRIAVPNLIGNSEIGARTMISSLGLMCNQVSYLTSDQPVGTVIAQSILSGTAVAAGTKISIVVSKGNS